MGTQDEPERPTIAGRALRALRTTRAPAEEPAVTEPPPVPVPPPVDLTKTRAEHPADVRDEAPEPAGPAAPRRRNAVLIGALVALVAALTYAAVGLMVYLRGTESGTSATAKARDDSLVAARIDLATLQTLDYKSAKAGLQKWLNVSTGDFHDSIAQQAKSVETAITKAKMTTSGKVIAAAVVDLDQARTTAIVIASVDTTKTPAGGKSALDRNRYRATMKLVGGVWKVADLSIVEVGLS